MNELIKAASEWPVLLQGAIGSGIFWLVLVAGQKISISISKKYSESSKKRRKNFLLEQRLKYYYKTTNDNIARGIVFSALTYRALRNFFKAIIWLTLGMLCKEFLSSLAIIGYVGTLYYLFAALNTVTAVPEEDDPSKKLEKINSELKKLDEA